MHRSAVGRVIPRQDGDPATPAVTWSLEQSDEKHGGCLVEHPPIARVAIGQTTLFLELDELAEVIDGLVGLHRRGRAQPVTGYAG